MKKTLALTALALLLAASSALAQSWGSSGTTTLSLVVGYEAELQINTSPTNFSTSAGTFSDYTGTTNLTYKIRTSQSAGTGSITVQVTTDFSPSGGPTVGGTQLTAGDNPTYTCSASSPATACSGSVTASTSAAQTIYSFAADKHSAKAGNPGSVTWTVPNDPLYPTGTYQATATFTISAS
jgi:hypothetical protein